MIVDRLDPALTAHEALPRIALLGGFLLQHPDGTSISLSGSAQQLFALLALQGRTVRRKAVAGMLWPESTEERALSSLRSSLGRLAPSVRALILLSPLDLRLDERVQVDLHGSRALADALLRGTSIPDATASAAALRALSADLLPDWYEEWAVVAAEDWHLLRVRALSVLADYLTDGLRFQEATSAAHAALAAEPLHEAAFATLVHVEEAQGHRAEALAVVARYHALLKKDSNASSLPSLADLIRIPSSARDAHQPAGELPVIQSNVLRQARTAVAGEETEAFEVVATGLSMEPSIRQGDTLVYSMNIPPTPGRIAVAIHDGVWIVKRIAQRDGVLVLRSDNADEEVSLSSVIFRGVVVELRRSI